MQINLFKVFIASPGDTLIERSAAETIVDEINRTIGKRENFRLELLKWENATYPDFGKDGQDVINRQIGDDYDIFIGIMWKRFGTPTSRAESGTEEEFERAYSRLTKGSSVKILLYFNSAPYPQADLQLEQLQKVQSFKSKINALGGYYWHYDGASNFERVLREHLTNHMYELVKTDNNVSVDGTETPDILPATISATFLEYLNDIEANFAHSKVDKITLEDIYIPPDLKVIDSKKAKIYKVENLSELSEAVDVEGIKFVLSGNELSGKTASTKYLFSQYYDHGLYPVILNGAEITNNIRPEIIQKLVYEKIQEQYSNIRITEIPKDQIVLIIDDFHKSAKGKNKYWPTLISNIEENFYHIILTGSTMMIIENLAEDAFADFQLFNILEFGPKYRYEIAKRWYSLGIDTNFIEQNDLLRKIDFATTHIKTIIGKNYVPSYPFYLLSILQSLESASIQNSNYSIHGFYYELIINDCFNRAVKDKKELSLYYNYLTFFCFYLYERETKEISMDEFKSFHITYCAKYDLTYSFEIMLRTFSTSKLLHVQNGKVQIKEKYVYYFFVAKYIANNITKPEIREIVTKMSIRIFRDEYAGIIMFITHLSKDEFIINELLKNAKSIFPEIPIARLEDDIKGINELIKSLPKQVLELVDVKQKREEELDEQEKSEKLEKELESELTNYDDFRLDDDLSTIDFYARITLALKTIDILGQISKKHWGEIDGDQKFGLVLETYNLGLRTLNFYLQALQSNSKEIVEHIEKLIETKHIKDRFSLKQAIEETAQNFVFKLCFMSSWGITKRIANSIGYDKLKNTFERTLENQPYNSVKLIDLAIKLSYSEIPEKLIGDYKEEMKNNNLSYVILKNLVIDHLYMYDTNHKTKSKLCSMLDISVQEQVVIDGASKIKRES